MTEQLYDVILSATTSAIPEWRAEAPCWEVLYSDAHMSAAVNTLTVKARYVTGVILAYCRSVEILLRREHLISTTYLPAFALFASAVDLIGRCVTGNSTNYPKKLRQDLDDVTIGFKWLAAPSASRYEAVKVSQDLVKTRSGKHSIDELVALRHYCAHGQAMHNLVDRYGMNPNRLVPTNRHVDCPMQNLDYLLLGEMPPVIGEALEAYLTELRTSDALAANLAKAGVLPFLDRPIFDSAWDFPADADTYPRAIGDTIRAMDWTYKDPRNIVAIVSDMELR